MHEDRTARDDIQRVARKALRIDKVTPPHLPVVGRTRQQLSLLQGQTGQQGHSAEQFSEVERRAR